MSRINIIAIAALAALALLIGHARAAEPNCITLQAAQKAVGKGSVVTPMTRAQFHFLQGVYALNPATPAGLPPGDGALLITVDDHGAVLFTIGETVCNPMDAPKALIELINKVKEGAVDDGDGT